MTRATSRSRVVLPVSLFLFGLAISAFTIRRGIDPFDEGLALQAARRVADGQVPYSNFLWPYGPAHPYLLAGLFKLFGTSLLWWRIVRVVVDASVALTVFVLLRGRVPRWAGLAAWLIAACAMAQPTGANPFAPALLFALLALLAARRGPVAAGLVAALASAWRIDFGVFAIAGVVAALAVGAPTQRLRAVLPAIGAWLGASLIVYLPFVISDGPADAWRDLFGRSLQQGRKWHLPFPLSYDGRLRLWPPGPLAHDAKDVLGFYVPLLLVLGLAICVVIAITQRRRLSPDSAGLLVMSVGFFAYLLSRTDEFHATPLIVTLVLLAPLLGWQQVAWPRVAVLAVVPALLLLYTVGNRLSALFDPPRLEPIHVAVADGVAAPAADARAIGAMVRAVQERVPPGDPIYTVTKRADLVRINDPLIYVLTDRDNPTRADFGLQTGAPAQREIVAVLTRARPRAIVRWTSPESTKREPNARGTPTGVHILDRWLAAHYRRDASFGYYEILVPVR